MLARIPEFLKLHWDVVAVIVSMEATATVQIYIDTDAVLTAHAHAMILYKKRLDVVAVTASVAINSVKSFYGTQELQNVGNVKVDSQYQ